MLEQYDALIFDLDGTLVDSMPLHLDAWEQTAAEFGLPFDRARLNSLGGIPTRKIVAMLAAEHDLAIDTEAFTRRKVALYLAQIDRVQVYPPMLELVKAQHGRRPMGVGTGSPRRHAEQILRQTGLDAYLPVLVSADDVDNHKPHPDTFLQVAQGLGVAPARCLVFEDTEIGLQAGRAAGMGTVLMQEGRILATAHPDNPAP